MFAEAKSEGFSYFTVLGFVGAFTLVSGWILVLIANYAKLEVFELPDWETFGYLMVNVIFGTVTYEFCNGKAIFYLGPVITDVTLCLVIPLSMAVEAIWAGAYF